MKYIIDEEELKNLDFNVVMSQTPREDTGNWINKIKSKTPVEEIAEGKVEKNNWNQFIFVKDDKTILGYINGYPNILAEEQKELLNNLTGKNIKIYIEVIK